MFSFLEDYDVRMENISPIVFLFEKIYNSKKYDKYDTFLLTFSTMLFILNGMLLNKPTDIDSISGFLQDIVFENYKEKLTTDESKEMAYYIMFELLQNGGFNYEFKYLNPDDKKEKKIMVKLIDQDYIKFGDKMRYKLTSQGLELLFMTKEVYKELRITIKQLYLKQQIEKHVFDDALKTIDDLSLLVREIREQISEVIRRIRTNVLNVDFTEYEKIHSKIFEQFDREKEEFKNIMEIVKNERETIELSDPDKINDEDWKALRSLNMISDRLNDIINEHNKLFIDKLDLQAIYKDAIKNQIAQGFRVRVNFESEILDGIIKNNSDIDDCRRIVAPILSLKRNKYFNIMKCTEEQVQKKSTVPIKNDIIDEVDENAIEDKKKKMKKRIENYKEYLRCILSNLNSKGETSLHIVLDRLDDEKRHDYINSFDFFAFLIMLHQAGEIDFDDIMRNKNESVGEVSEEVDMEFVIISVLEENPSYQNYKSITVYRGDKDIKLSNGVVMSDFIIKSSRSFK